MNNEEKCPVCGNEEYMNIEVGGGGEYPPYIYAYRGGSVDVVCCTNCGVTRLTKKSLERIKNKSN